MIRKGARVLEGLVVAVFLAIAATAGFTALDLVLRSEPACRLTILAVGFVYVVYLAVRSPIRGGKTVMVLALAALAAALIVLQASVLTVVMLGLITVWLLRSVLYHRSIMGLICDGALIAVSTVFGVWLFVLSGSLGAAAWGFLLGQSLFVLLPGKGALNRASECSEHQPVVSDQFERAFKAAEEALVRSVQAAEITAAQKTA